MRYFRFTLLFLFISMVGMLKSQVPLVEKPPERLKYPVKSKFLDSLKVDSLRKILASPFTIKFPTEKVNAVIDPYDALNNTLYAQKSTSRFWFFAVFVIAIAGLILYLQNFPSQFFLRLQSIFNSIKYREFLSEKKSRIFNGSIYLIIFNSMVLGLTYFVLLLRLRFFELNNTAFYLLLVLSLIIVKILIYGVQLIQARVLDLQETHLNITQRHINVELVFSLFFLPISVFYYYNPQFLFNTSMQWMVVIVGISLVLRLLVEFIGIIQDSNARFQVLLYFCTLEILPLAIIATVIIQRLYANG